MLPAAAAAERERPPIPDTPKGERGQCCQRSGRLARGTGDWTGSDHAAVNHVLLLPLPFTLAEKIFVGGCRIRVSALA
jgi:hypothetical protein